MSDVELVEETCVEVFMCPSPSPSPTCAGLVYV